MKTRKLLALVLALLMLLTVFAGCGKQPAAETPAAEEPAAEEPAAEEPAAEEPAAEEPAVEEPAEEELEPIKIGHIVDLTGSEAASGMVADECLTFALKCFGGKLGGHPVEIVVGDGMGTPDTAVDVARKMVEVDGVVAVFGPTQAGQKNAVADYMKEAGVPLIFYSGTPAYTFMGNDWLIGAGGANPQMNVIADYAYNEMGLRTVNIMTMDNIGFRTFTDDFKTLFEGLGGTVVSEHYAPFPTSDWSSYMAAVSGTPADAIVAWTTGSNAIAFWKDWYQSGLSETQPVVAILQSAFTEHWVLEALDNIDPEITKSVLGTKAPAAYCFDIDSAENDAFIDLWVAEFGTVPDTNLAGQAYQALQMFDAALSANGGDTSPDALIAALRATDIYSPAGHLVFGESGAAIKDIYITDTVQLEDGTYNNVIVKTYEAVPSAGLTAG